jgi:hypothetical protein
MRIAAELAEAVPAGNLSVEKGDAAKSSAAKWTGRNQKGGYVMGRGISLALLIGGILLLVFGVSAADSLSSDLSNFFTGSPTDKAVWMLIGGAVLSVVGLVGLLRGPRAT